MNDKYELIKFKDNEIELDVNVSPNEETVWLTKEQMSQVFGRDRSVITRHIINIYEERELDQNTSCAKHAHQINGQTHYIEYFNLDVILSVGYRVRSPEGNVFRRWANKVLRQYLTKGYVINNDRCLICQQSIVDISNRLSLLEHNISHHIEFNADETLKGFLSIKRYLESARESILIIDNYFNHDFDEVLRNIKVKITIITNTKNKNIESNDIYTVIHSNNFHDRYIFVDDICYKSGQSLKDIGSKISSLNREYDRTQEEMIKKA